MAETDLDHPHRCLGCGYSLTGLPDPPRCPECGLLNIPDGFRKQVWDLVDSGKWFFSSMFGPFKKRPPGWWWALDRDDDIRRSYRFLIRNLLVAACVVVITSTIAKGFIQERTHTFTIVDLQDPTGTPVDRIVWVEHDSVGTDGENTSWIKHPDWSTVWHRGHTTSETISTRSIYVASPQTVLAGAFGASWIALIWAVPSLIGLWTQIRKNLPEFSIGRRTIVAACNYESHRLIFVSLVLTAFWLVDLLVRLRGIWMASPITYILVHNGVLIAVALFAAAGWIGPLRSDFTRLLVRSRLHLWRIVLMYAWAFPFLIAGSIAELISMLTSE